MKNKKGFTLVEILGAVVILAILAVVVIGAISYFVNKGKEEYDNSLEKQFLLAGQEYYSNYPDKLPDTKGSNFVTLAELRSLNIVKDDFVDAYGNVCSNEESAVMATSNGNKDYDYKACLVCPGSSKFIDSSTCIGNIGDGSDDLNNPTECKIIKNNEGGYTVYNKTGEHSNYTSEQKLNAVTTYLNSGCGNFKDCSTVTIAGIKFYYGGCDANGCKVYENERAAQNDKVCLLSDSNRDPNCIKWKYWLNRNYYYLNTNSCPTNYTCAINNSSITNIDSLITGLNKGVVSDESINANNTYYSYYLTSSALKTIQDNKKTMDSTPSYSSSGTTSTVNYYFKTARQSRSKLINSSYSYVYKNKAIPAEYSFLIGKSSKTATITNPSRMSSSELKKWGSEYSTVDKKGIAANATSSVKGKYKARYYSVGSYKGKKVDIVMTLVNYSGCKPNEGASKCGFWFDSGKLGINSLGVGTLTVKYNFYEAGTNTPIYVKGYTTYWDIDAHQGIHFTKNTTGLYVYSGNAIYISKVNGAPYIYEYNDTKYYGSDDAAAVTETFAGTYMQKTFTFMSGPGNYSKISSSWGTISHSTTPIATSLSYYSGANATSVLNKDSTVKYIFRFSNTTSSSKSIKLTVNIGNMTYVSGSAKFKDGTVKNPSKSGNTLTWTKTVAGKGTDYLIFSLKASGNTACGQVASVSAKSLVGSTTYSTATLKNPVVCKEKQTIGSQCLEWN